MRTWIFYRVADGTWVDRSMSLDDVGTDADRCVARNTPANCKAFEVLTGISVDRSYSRFDVASGTIVAYERPAPEVAAEQRAARERRARRRIDELEQSQLRPMRELAIDPANAEAKRRLAEIDGEIAGLRPDLQQPGATR